MFFMYALLATPAFEEQRRANEPVHVLLQSPLFDSVALAGHCFILAGLLFNQCNDISKSKDYVGMGYSLVVNGFSAAIYMRIFDKLYAQKSMWLLPVLVYGVFMQPYRYYLSLTQTAADVSS